MTSVRKLKRADFLFASALFLATTLLYLPAVNFSADIFDDGLYTEKLTAPEMGEIDFVAYIATPVLKLHSPLVKLSFAADRLLWGQKFFFNGLHFSNILYHAAAAVLLYCLCRKLVVRLPGKTAEDRIVFFRFHLPPVWAAAAAAIWAWHPQRVESVTWISERKDVLLSILFFATLLTFIKAFRHGSPCIAAFVFFLLSLAVKPMLVTLPAVLLVWMKIETGRFFSKRNMYTLAPFAAVVVLLTAYYVLFARVANSDTDLGSPLFRAAVTTWNIGNYFKSAVFPVKLMPFYPFYDPAEDTPAAAAVFAFLLVITGMAALRGYLPGGIIFAVLLLFPITLFPVCGIVRVGNCDWADRYNLLPSLFLLLPAVFILRCACPSRKKLTLFVSAAALTYIGFLCTQTILYLDVWRSYKSVVLASVEDTRRANYRIRFLAALLAFEEGDMKTVISVASSITPDAAATPADKKLIRVFHCGMTGLLESLGGNPDVGGRRLTELVLGPDAELMCKVSDGFLDWSVDASAYWNVRRNNIATAIKLYETSARLSLIPLRREEMAAQTALLKKDAAAAEKAIALLEEKRHPSAAKLRAQLTLLKNQPKEKAK